MRQPIGGLAAVVLLACATETAPTDTAVCAGADTIDPHTSSDDDDDQPGGDDAEGDTAEDDGDDDSDGDSDAGSDDGSGSDDSPVDTGDVDPTPTCAFSGATFDEDELHEHIAYLASDELAGRRPGSEGDETTRQFIEDHFTCLGLEPGADGDAYQQPFIDEEGAATANVVGILPGSDPDLAHERIVVFGHFDHFGIIDGEIYRGANDNASGTVAMMALATAFAELDPAPRRTLVFIGFGSEEFYLSGSYHFIDEPPAAVPLDQIVYQIDLDMLGTFTQNAGVEAYGSFEGTPGREILESLLEPPMIPDFILGNDGAGESDYDAFCQYDIPYIYFETFDVDCWHEPCDDADRIDYEHLRSLTALSFELTRALADTDLDLAAAREEHGCPA